MQGPHLILDGKLGFLDHMSSRMRQVSIYCPASAKDTGERRSSSPAYFYQLAWKFLDRSITQKVSTVGTFRGPRCFILHKWSLCKSFCLCFDWAKFQVDFPVAWLCPVTCSIDWAPLHWVSPSKLLAACFWTHLQVISLRIWRPHCRLYVVPWCKVAATWLIFFAEHFLLYYIG